MSEICREAGRATTARKAQAAYGSLNGYIRLMRQTGMSLRDIAARLNAEGHRSRSGQDWNHGQVARVLKYFAA